MYKSNIDDEDTLIDLLLREEIQELFKCLLACLSCASVLWLLAQFRVANVASSGFFAVKALIALELIYYLRIWITKKRISDDYFGNNYSEARDLARFIEKYRSSRRILNTSDGKLRRVFRREFDFARSRAILK